MIKPGEIIRVPVTALNGIALDPNEVARSVRLITLSRPEEDDKCGGCYMKFLESNTEDVTCSMCGNDPIYFKEVKDLTEEDVSIGTVPEGAYFTVPDFRSTVLLAKKRGFETPCEGCAGYSSLIGSSRYVDCCKLPVCTLPEDFKFIPVQGSLRKYIDLKLRSVVTEDTDYEL